MCSWCNDMLFDQRLSVLVAYDYETQASRPDFLQLSSSPRREQMRLQHDQNPNKANYKVFLRTGIYYVYIYLSLQSLLGFQFKLLNTYANTCLAHITSIPLPTQLSYSATSTSYNTNQNHHAYDQGCRSRLRVARWSLCGCLGAVLLRHLLRSLRRERRW